jgi:3-hydroxyisobutyrate dehydrogenase-like beta-hydroxyacid dehydrogenase
MLDEGQRCGAALPFTTLHKRILQELEDAGFGGEDNSAVIRAFRFGSVSPMEMP